MLTFKGLLLLVVGSRLGQWLVKKLMEQLAEKIRAWRLRKIAEEENKKVDEAAEKLTAANEIKDQETRLDAKAKAACEMEKLGRPDSTCGLPDETKS